MTIDRSAHVNVGDLLDLEERLEAKLEAKFEQQTRSLAGEISRFANVIMEHTTAQIRVVDDHTKAVEDRLVAHVADTTVHRRPTRARRS